MLLNLLINYYGLKKRICRDKYKKIKLKLKHKNPRSVNISQLCVITQNRDWDENDQQLLTLYFKQNIMDGYCKQLNGLCFPVGH